MRKILAILVLGAMILSMGAMAESIRPNTDVLMQNADGEYVTIFGPGNFWFADGQFPNPVTMVNGTARIGGR